MKTIDLLAHTREIAELNQIIANEATLATPSRGFLEAYAARLLKRSAQLYAATLPRPSSSIERGVARAPQPEEPHAA